MLTYLFSPMEQYQIYTIFGIHLELNQIVFYLIISTSLIIGMNFV